MMTAPSHFYRHAFSYTTQQGQMAKPGNYPQGVGKWLEN
jgi:hypothetical protein